MAGRFAGKVLVVTGGGGGIGRAVAERFAAGAAREALVDADITGAISTVDGGAMA